MQLRNPADRLKMEPQLPLEMPPVPDKEEPKKRVTSKSGVKNPRKDQPAHYLVFLNKVYNSTNDEKYAYVNIQAMAKETGVSTGLGSILQEMNIIEKKKGKKGLYRWSAPEPNIDMASAVADWQRVRTEEKKKNPTRKQIIPKPKAEVDPEPKREPVLFQQSPMANPLESYRDEELIAELKRRGFKGNLDKNFEI